nr:C40 family peptidase [Myxococcota bacterium]
ELRVAIEPLALRCGPLVAPLYSSPPDPAFDRNACSTIERQDPVQVLARWGDELLLVRSRYALGWIAADAPLSPAVPAEDGAIWTEAPRARSRGGLTLRSEGDAAIEVDPDVLLPIDPESADRLRFATRDGFHRSVTIERGLVDPVRRPLTRRAFLTEAFRHLDRPYGWGGREGGLDCSELVMDTLGTFGIEMPRHSARQAQAGSFSIEVPPDTSEADRLRLLDAAASRGIVLLHFPGHVMIWLGRTSEGEPRILHSFAEYLEPCEGGGETLRRVNRVSVSDLELGRGTTRRAFLERLERIVVIGRSPGPELAGVATLRPALPVEPPTTLECSDSLRTRIFQSPAMPHAGAPLRFVITSSDDLGPVDVELRDPSGRVVRPSDVHRLGGPPWTFWVEVARPAAGRWTIAIGDGERVAACDRVNVARQPRDATDALPMPIGPEARLSEPNEAIWVPRWSWEEDTENLYAAFVEQLYAYPVDDRTWRSLSELLRDREHNLLFGHLGQGEEARLELVPDCADLPYFLRAYFAWKLRLPFAYRRCSRGRAGVPPSCGEAITPAMPHEQPDEVEAFRWFIERHLRPGVHSASGRTSPRDEATDLYPVPLTREALRPGTVFADPYGHLLIVSAWQPQGAGGSGVLYGADAQPDGTIGRRTFWRGTFLFTPDTGDVGAGFKAFRPVVYDHREDLWTTLTNDELRGARDATPWSDQQYRGTQDDFYERMETLINPRALDPAAMQLALVDALEESVVRRVVSVDNGEEWHRANAGAVIPMPEDLDIFLTEGAWEDFSTPSRDMRLLVAIDTVVGLPESLRRNPARWGLSEGAELDAAVERAHARLREELASRRFTYTRSDGAPQELTLADVVAREDAIETAWNPNDCVEVRWGAPDGSPERASCARHAPAEQRERMARMREWFASRQRPTR